MARKSSRPRQAHNSFDADTSERARIVAAFMGLLVEQSIRKMDFGQIAARAHVSLAQLHEELGSTINILTAQMEEMDCLVLAGENVEMPDRAHRLAMLLTSVLRAWLKGEDPHLARAMSVIERAGVWA